MEKGRRSLPASLRPAPASAWPDELFETFELLGRGRVGAMGHGLGLSAVRSIAHAPGPVCTRDRDPAAGFIVAVSFPDGAVSGLPLRRR